MDSITVSRILIAFQRDSFRPLTYIYNNSTRPSISSLYWIRPIKAALTFSVHRKTKSSTYIMNLIGWNWLTYYRPPLCQAYRYSWFASDLSTLHYIFNLSRFEGSKTFEAEASTVKITCLRMRIALWPATPVWIACRGEHNNYVNRPIYYYRSISWCFLRLPRLRSQCPHCWVWLSPNVWTWCRLSCIDFCACHHQCQCPSSP